MLEITSTLEGGDRARRRAERLYAAMSLKNKRRYNYYLGLEVGKASRQHVKAQTDLDGRPWAKRKRKPGKKVLTRIARRNRLRITSNEDVATVTHKRRQTGLRARIHQEGGSERVTAAAVIAARTKAGFGVGEATKGQLKSLRKLGVDTGRLQQQEGGLSWLRAGVIIKALRRRRSRAAENTGGGKTSWTINYPARSFLGLSLAERAEAGQKVFNKLLQDVESGRV